MLVLQRKLLEEVVILLPDNREVVISLVDSRDSGRKIRLGIQAPPDIAVHRREVLDQIRQQELTAASKSAE